MHEEGSNFSFAVTSISIGAMDDKGPPYRVLSGVIVGHRQISTRHTEVPTDNTFNQRNVRLFRASEP